MHAQNLHIEYIIMNTHKLPFVHSVGFRTQCVQPQSSVLFEV